MNNLRLIAYRWFISEIIEDEILTDLIGQLESIENIYKPAATYLPLWEPFEHETCKSITELVNSLEYNFKNEIDKFLKKSIYVIKYNFQGIDYSLSIYAKNEEELKKQIPFHFTVLGTFVEEIDFDLNNWFNPN